MVEDLRVYKQMIEAIKFSISNNNVESDLRQNNIENIINKLLVSDDIKKLALRKVKSNDWRRKME